MDVHVAAIVNPGEGRGEPHTRRNIMHTLRFAFVLYFVVVALAGCSPGNDPYLDREQFDLPVNGTAITTTKPLAPYTRYVVRFSSPLDLGDDFRFEEWLGLFYGGYASSWRFALDGAERLGTRTKTSSNNLINHVVFEAQGTGQQLRLRTTEDLTDAFDAPTLSVLVLRSRWWRQDTGAVEPLLLVLVLGLPILAVVFVFFRAECVPSTHSVSVCEPAPPPAPDPWLLSWVRDHRYELLEQENLTDPAFQKHLLWRHRRAYHDAVHGWQPGDGAIELPAFPMSIPVTVWRKECKALDNPDLCDYLAAHEPRLLKILRAMHYLCIEAERVVVRPSAANDHLAVMEAQLEQLNAINARAQDIEERIRVNAALSEQEQNAQIEWVQEMYKQRIRQLLKEDDHGASKDEVISPE